MSKPTSRLRRSLPVALVVVGVTLLIGCIYVPATRAFQTNGHLRPEHLVGGASSSRPVRVGVTPIEDALLPLIRQAEPNADLPRHLEVASSVWVHQSARRIGIRYRINKGTMLSICGIYGDSDDRMLTLDVDDRGVVTAAEAIDPRDNEHARTFRPITPDDADRLFTPETIRRLQAAGWLMSDAEREQYRRRETQRRERMAEIERRWRERMAAYNATTTRASTAPTSAAPAATAP